MVQGCVYVFLLMEIRLAQREREGGTRQGMIEWTNKRKEEKASITHPSLNRTRTSNPNE